MLVKCPSGLTFHAREWNLGDRAALVDVKRNDTVFLPLKMLELALLPDGVEEPGPYKFAKGSKPDVQVLSYADIIAANVKVRAATEPIYRQQPICDVCKTVCGVDVPMDKMLAFPASKEGFEHLMTGQPIVRQTEDGSVFVKIRALRGSDLPVLSELQDKDMRSMIEAHSCLSIQEIIHKQPGQSEATSISGFIPVQNFWRTQTWKFADLVEDVIDEAFGGVDMSYTFRCDNFKCNTEGAGMVPLDPGFYGLDPAARLNKRRRASLDGR